MRQRYNCDIKAFISQMLSTALQPQKSLPISKPSKDIHDSIKNLVESRLNNSENYSDLEREIDQLVYELYGLTAGEIAIVEGKRGKF